MQNLLQSPQRPRVAEGSDPENEMTENNYNANGRRRGGGGPAKLRALVCKIEEKSKMTKRHKATRNSETLSYEIPRISLGAESPVQRPESPVQSAESPVQNEESPVQSVE